MARIEREVRKTANRATRGKSTGGKKGKKTRGSTGAEKGVRKAAKKLT